MCVPTCVCAPNLFSQFPYRQKDAQQNLREINRFNFRLKLPPPVYQEMVE